MYLLFIIWDVNPEIININGFGIRWYGLFFALGFLFGYLIMQKVFKLENRNQKSLDRLSIYMLISTVLGARLGHCFFYEPEYYLSNPLEILNIRQGGLASHGAAIGIIIGLLVYSVKEKLHVSWILDRIVIVVSLAGALIRTGNLFNSEIYGKITSVPWAFRFLKIEEDYMTAVNNAGLNCNSADISCLINFWPARHPTQIYEAFVYLLLFFVLWRLYFKYKAHTKPFLMFGVFLLVCFGFRFFVEFIKDVQVSSEKDMILNIGQKLSIPFVVLGIFFIYRALKLSEK
jgi:prolipoprotein diacylglyceryl transferase